MTIRIAIVGYGKIARTEHVPAITDHADFELVGIVSPHDAHDARDACVPVFSSLADMLAALPDGVDAAAICTPPQLRHALASEAIDARLAVLLEKPPAVTLGELERLGAQARAAGTALFAAWHSQFAPAVVPAAAQLAGERLARLALVWREDVRRWHPGQDWIWEADGLGVLDTGLNALSILTAILPEPLVVEDAELVIPAGRQAPIAARLRFAGQGRAAQFDWREQREEVRSIRATTQSGRVIALEHGGARLVVDGIEHPLGPLAEYAAIYARFAALVRAGAIALDSEPMRLLADAMRIARRVTTGGDS